jgi:hypothetical protein
MGLTFINTPPFPPSAPVCRQSTRASHPDIRGMLDVNDIFFAAFVGPTSGDTKMLARAADQAS